MLPRFWGALGRRGKGRLAGPFCGFWLRPDAMSWPQRCADKKRRAPTSDPVGWGVDVGPDLRGRDVFTCSVFPESNGGAASLALCARDSHRTCQRSVLIFLHHLPGRHPIFGDVVASTSVFRARGDGMSGRPGQLGRHRAPHNLGADALCPAIQLDKCCKHPISPVTDILVQFSPFSSRWRCTM